MEKKVVLFWAEGCEPCNHMKPVVEELSKELKIELESYNMMDKGVEEFAKSYGIKGWPHIFVVKDDIIMTEVVGYDLTAKRKENKKRLQRTLEQVYNLPVSDKN